MAKDNIYPPFNYTLGRPLKYKPDEMLEKFQDYVSWAKGNPISIEKNVVNTTTKGETYKSDSVETKPRLISIKGFLVFLGAGSDWWQSLDREGAKRAEEFSRVKSFIRDYCESYQSEMASADIFNANIVSRLLGLADKKDITSGGEKLDRIIVQSEEERDKVANIKDLDV